MKKVVEKAIGYISLATMVVSAFMLVKLNRECNIRNREMKGVH